jgi:hypothetical protein
MKPTQQLELEITTAVSAGLRALGFEKQKHRFSKRIDKDRLGWCGLNIARKNISGIGVNPVVGLAFDPVENFIKKIIPEHREGTFRSSIGYLMPERRYLEWVISLHSPNDVEAKAKEIVTAVALYGLPFMNQFSSLEAVIEAQEQFQFTDRASAIDRLPILYNLAGRQEQANTLLQKRSIELAALDDWAARDQKRLVAALMSGNSPR